MTEGGSQKETMTHEKPTLDAIFRPRSIAVIGASTRKGALGREIFEKLVDNDFAGPVYPIHPTADFIHAVRAYPDISSVQGPVDLAIVVVPRDQVLPVVEGCARAGVKGLVVITAGFRETGRAGAEQEARLLDIVRRSGMRMIGPNCMGIINTDPAIRLDATFAPTTPRRGNLALASQSGALGVTILEHAHALNLGVSMFASLGNKADISGNDLLEYWRDDPSVEVILMYLESFGNPPRFIELAREVGRKKPIIVVKSGRTRSGARAAASHTGALAGLDAAYDALFRQCGVLRADTIEEMFDLALALADQPLPANDRTLIVTNAGGPGIMAADACEGHGLKVPHLDRQTQEKLRSRLRPEASSQNPVDLLADATADDYQFALDLALADSNVDAAIVIYVPPIMAETMQVAKRISEVAKSYRKPVLGCLMGVKGIATGVEELQRSRIPAYAFPESAARALGAMVRYRRWRERPEGRRVSLPMDLERVRSLLQPAIKNCREFLTSGESLELLRAAGIPTAEFAVCLDEKEAVEEAEKIGYPVVLKIDAADVVHKSDVGGVILGLGNRRELTAAVRRLSDAMEALNLPSAERRLLVQEMVPDGRETILGLSAVPQFGHLVMFGLGGIYTEVLADVAFRVVPLLDSDAADMVREIRGLPILQGVRGEPAIDFAVVEDALLRLSQLAEQVPEIIEADLNPFLTFPQAEACKAVDARIRVRTG
jgi:acetyl coenzyme A synthetase (ADP forming)-like protein